MTEAIEWGPAIEVNGRAMQRLAFGFRWERQP